MASNIYILKGQCYNISDADEAQEALTVALNEVRVEGTEEETLIQRIIDRVRILMETHYGEIKRESKLREKAILLRGQIRKRITESLKRVLDLVDNDPTSEEAVTQARNLNN